jgi:hypothetical protein
MILRVHAIYGHNRYVALVLSLCLCGQLILQSIAVAQATGSSTPAFPMPTMEPNLTWLFSLRPRGLFPCHKNLRLLDCAGRDRNLDLRFYSMAIERLLSKRRRHAVRLNFIVSNVMLTFFSAMKLFLRVSALTSQLPP